MAEAVGSASARCTRQVFAAPSTVSATLISARATWLVVRLQSVFSDAKKTPRISPRRFSFVERFDLLRDGLLEHAVHLLVRSVAARLACLSGLQSLVCSALRAVGCRAGRLSRARRRVGSSLGSSSVLHGLVGRCANLIDGRLRDATAARNEREGGKACLHCGGDRFLHDFFPLLGRTKMTRATNFHGLLIRRSYGLFPQISPQKSLFCKSSWARPSAEDTRLSG